MNANPENSHLRLSFRTPKKTNFGGALVESSLIQINSELTFDEHIFSINKNVDEKINAPIRLVNYVSFDKRRMVMKAFIESQFHYCPLIQMFYSRTLNNKINCLHERALRIAYSNYKSLFCELLEKDKSFLIHHRNIQVFT